jgi:hypothetical protein
MVPRDALAGKHHPLSVGIAMPDQQPEHLTTTEARAGSTPHMTRYVLVGGLLLVIVIFAIILFIAG